jgi:membrane protease YdiL (CAAX protease family)
MPIFWNPVERRLRALWRLLLQAALMVACGLVPILGVAEPLTWLHRRGLFLAGYAHDDYDRVVNMIIGPLLAVAVIGSIVLAARWLDHRRVEEFGVRLDRPWWNGLALGFGVGALVMTLVFIIEYALGWIMLTGTMATTMAGIPLGLSLLFSVVKVLCVGTYEEFLSRGYHLKNLTEGLTPRWGVVVSASIFALLHLANDNAGLLSTVGIFVNGLFFSAALIATGRLSTAIGAHIAWNFVQGTVFGFPVSGDKEGASLIGLQQSGPGILTGGDFGPEAGLVGILASLAGIGLLLVWRRRYAAAGDGRSSYNR